MSRAATSNYELSKTFTAGTSKTNGSEDIFTKGRFFGYRTVSNNTKLRADVNSFAVGSDQKGVLGVVVFGVKEYDKDDFRTHDREFEGVVAGVSKVILEAGAAVSVGDYVTSDGTGKAIVATGPVRTLALATESAGKAGDYFQALVL